MDSSPSSPTRLTAPAPAPSATAEACPLTPASFPPAPAATDGTATTRAEFPASPPAPAATDSSSTTRADSSSATRADSTAATTRAEFPASPPAPAATDCTATTRAEFPASPPAPAATDSSSATRADSTASTPAADATNASPQTRAEPPASPLAPAVSAPEVSWAFRFAQIGGGIEDYGTYLGGWETSLRERSQFFLRVAGYVPEGEFPEIVLWMARACRGISRVLGHLARMAKGASGICRLVGSEIKRLAQGYGQGTVDGDIENPDSAPRFIMITSLTQLQQVVATNRGSSIRLQIDVDPAMTPSLAKTCFELLNAEGPYGQEMMRNAQNMIRKLAEHEEMSARRQAPRSPGT